MADTDARIDAQEYCIKPGYRHRDAPEYYLDIVTERDHVVWQPDVYPLAAALADRLGASRLIDLGPGRGEKVAALGPRFQVLGIDFGPNLEMCREMVPGGTWREHDFDSALDLPVAPEELDGSVVICSDVIEHLVRPERLLNQLRRLLDSVEAIVISTPERVLTRGPDDMGPPANPCHVREWSIAEFAALLEAWGFEHGTLQLTRSNDLHNLDETILALLFPDPERHRRAVQIVEAAVA